MHAKNHAAIHRMSSLNTRERNLYQNMKYHTHLFKNDKIRFKILRSDEQFCRRDSNNKQGNRDEFAAFMRV